MIDKENPYVTLFRLKSIPECESRTHELHFSYHKTDNHFDTRYFFGVNISHHFYPAKISLCSALFFVEDSATHFSIKRSANLYFKTIFKYLFERLHLLVSCSKSVIFSTCLIFTWEIKVKSIFFTLKSVSAWGKLDE